MLFLAIAAFLTPIFLGYALSRLLFKNLDAIERFISSVSLGVGVFGLLFFILNEFFFIKFDFTNALILLLFMILISLLLLLFDSRIRTSIGHLTNSGLRIKKGYRILYFKNHVRYISDIYYRIIIFFKKDSLIKIFLLFSVFLILYKSLFFPIISGDGLGFHAPIIKEIYESGGMSHDVGTNTVEFTRAYPPIFFIYGAWMSILNGDFSEIFVRLIPAFFGFLVLLTVYILARNIVFKTDKTRRYALLSCFLLMTLPMFVNHNVYLNNDTIFVFFAIAGLYFIMKYLNDFGSDSDSNLKNLLVGFLIIGFSINVKQLGLPFFISIIVPLFLILFYAELLEVLKISLKDFKKGLKKLFQFIRKRELRHFLIAIILVLIVIAPYMLRNYVFFNDPMYPYFSSSPTLSKYFHGKNFIPELNAPLAETYEKWNLFYSPEYSFYSIVNFVKDKDYSMSLFLLFLIVIVLLSFKNLNKNQKYLLYFSILYFAYFAYTFLLKYRYAMIVFAMLCIVCAAHFDSLLKYRPIRIKKFFAILFFIGIIFSSMFYALVLMYKEYVVGVLGPLSSRFISGLDVSIVLHLIIALFAIIIVLFIRNKKIRYCSLILVLIIPSLYNLALINYGLTTESTGVIDANKDMDLFRDKILKFVPDRDAVLKMNFGDDYETQLFIRNNIPKESVIIAYGGVTYYSEREVILIDSYKIYDTYNANISESLEILRNLNIRYILYKHNGWEEIVFNRAAVYDKSAITKNINNQEMFKPIYKNSQYVVYEVIYED